MITAKQAREIKEEVILQAQLADRLRKEQAAKRKAESAEQGRLSAQTRLPLISEAIETAARKGEAGLTWKEISKDDSDSSSAFLQSFASEVDGKLADLGFKVLWELERMQSGRPAPLRQDFDLSYLCLSIKIEW